MCSYQDHTMALAPFHLSDDAETFDSLYRQEPGALETAERQWLETGDGVMAGNPFDAGAKLRPNADDLNELGPEFEKRWNDVFLKHPDKPVMWLGIGSAYLKPSLAHQGKFASLVFHSMSICPSNVGANTYNTALGIGEKAAVIIAEDLGIPIPSP
ncbi:hypothetical protein HGRIS_003975 [Hohenbuehelia grisea]|uniref:Uncharacterized protein n=1 Tax=Hohenbuehelia grisea TaxID=104357 RepID=A0ABR3JHQ5_9AGAR